MSAMTSSLSRTSVRVPSMSLTTEWNSERLLLCCRRMYSSPLEREGGRERGREREGGREGGSEGGREGESEGERGR